MKLEHYLISLRKINSNGLRTSVRWEVTKLLEANIGKNLLDIDVGNDFLDMTSKAQAMKQK